MGEQGAKIILFVICLPLLTYSAVCRYLNVLGEFGGDVNSIGFYQYFFLVVRAEFIAPIPIIYGTCDSERRHLSKLLMEPIINKLELWGVVWENVH
jgi:hypothetical protein